MRRLAFVIAAAILSASCAPTPKAPPKEGVPATCSATLEAAGKLVSDGYLSRARRVLEARSDCGDVLAQQSVIAASLGQLDQASAHLAQARKRGLDAELEAHAASELTRAKATQNARTGSAAEAEQALTQAVSAYARGDCQASQAAAQRSLSLRFPNPAAWFAVARAHACSGEPRAMRVAFEHGLAESDGALTWGEAIDQRVQSTTWSERETFLLHGKTVTWELGPGVAGEGWQITRRPEPAPDSRVYVVGAAVEVEDSTVRRRVDGEILWEVEIKDGLFFEVEPDILYVVTRPASEPPRLLRLDMKTGKQLSAWEMESGDEPNALVLGHGWLAVGGTGLGSRKLPRLIVYDKATGKIRLELGGPSYEELRAGVDYCSFELQLLPFDEHHVITPCYSKASGVTWPSALDVRTGKWEQLPLAVPPVSAYEVVFGPRGARAFLLSDTVAATKRNAAGEWAAHPTRFEVSFPDLWSAAFSPTGRWLSAYAQDRQVSIWNTETGARAFAWGAFPPAGELEIRTQIEDDHLVGLLRCDEILTLDARGGVHSTEQPGLRCNDSSSSFARGMARMIAREASSPAIQLTGGVYRATGTCEEHGGCSAELFQEDRKIDALLEPESLVALGPKGHHMVTLLDRDNRIRIRKLPTGEVIQSFEVEPDATRRALFQRDEDWVVVWIKGEWKKVELGQGKPSVGVAALREDALDVTRDGKVSVGSAGLCRGNDNCVPLEAAPAIRTQGTNDRSTLACTDCSESELMTLRFFAGDRLVLGTAADRVDIWNAANGDRLGTLRPSQTHGWFFVEPGPKPENERPIQILSQRATAGLACRLGKEWFSWKLCKSVMEIPSLYDEHVRPVLTQAR